MPARTIGVVLDGSTGRLGTTQHLKALLAIRGEGGLPLKDGDRLLPEPLLLGRNPEKLAALAAASGGLRWSLDRDACLADPASAIYFDANWRNVEANLRGQVSFLLTSGAAIVTMPQWRDGLGVLMPAMSTMCSIGAWAGQPFLTRQAITRLLRQS